MVWLGIQLVELLVVITLFRWLVPATWSAGARVVLVIAIVGLLTWVNHAARRRFIPR
jgi:hypothetical protein